jgi:dihydrofolate reductase
LSLIKLYIATSIDGFIARKDGSLDWLEDFPNPDKLDYGYLDFLENIDTIVMGRNTYEAILSFGMDWPYADSKSYVISSKEDFKIETENTYLINTLTKELINQIRTESKKNIWIVGGGKLISSFLNHRAIDELILTIIPTILGDGIPLFPNKPLETQFTLKETQTYKTGVVSLNYLLQ